MQKHIIDRRERLQQALGRKVLVLDGGMGTMIQSLRLSEKDFRRGQENLPDIPLAGCNDLLTLTSPQNILHIHRQYLEAGADIISTDTFNANALSLAEYGIADRAVEIASAGARLARKAVDEFADKAGPRELFVAGSMGPSGVSLSLLSQENPHEAPDMFRKMEEAFFQQAKALIEGGVDIILLETCFDTLNAKAAVRGVRRAFLECGVRLPLWISATLSENGRLLSGQNLEAFLASMAHAEADVIGLNCGFGAESMISHATRLAGLTDAFVSIHPNAGLPDDMGAYSQTPDLMAAGLSRILHSCRINIIGGCCGTTPDHIRAISSLVADVAPEAAPYVAPTLTVSASDAFTFDSSRGQIVKVGERCNVAGSRKFLRLAAASDWNGALEVAENQISKGAALLDVNMDDGMLDAPRSMEDFVSVAGSGFRTAATPLMIDSSSFEVISRSLRMIQGKSIVNSISLKNGEEEFLLRAAEIRSLGAAVVVMAFDEKGQADTLSRRIEICGRAYRLLTEKAGYRGCDIIFDPNVLAVATGIPEHDRYALDFLEATRWIKSNLEGALVSGGLSNLSFSFRGNNHVRRAMHSVFLEHARDCGMDMAIVDPATPLDAAWVEPELRSLIDDLLLCRRDDAADRLIEFATRLKQEEDARKAGGKGAPSASSGASKEAAIDPCARLQKALIEGMSHDVESLVEEAMEMKGSAMSVVGDVLMPGMDRIGELFAEGRMYLPQVVRAATVMKRAVAVLTPAIEREQTSGGAETAGSRPLMVLATVRGDVHDIGKNIVAIVMRCSGFDVKDLGVMVEPEQILDEAEREGACCVGLSGLITPSLQEMITVARMMRRRGMKIPLFVGGATTSQLHAAVRIAPEYDGPVVRTADAAALPAAVHSMVDAATSAAAFKALREEQERLRLKYLEESGCRKEVKSARSRVDTPAETPKHSGRLEFSIPPAEIEGLINWRAYLHEWSLPPRLVSDLQADGPENPSRSLTATESRQLEEARRIIRDARAAIKDIPGNMTARVEILPASGQEDEILIHAPEGEVKLQCPRMQKPMPESEITLSLADFVASESDHIGIFAVTAARSGLPEMIASAAEHDEYRSLLLQALSHRLAEAATEWMHHRVAEIWGTDVKGIRPAVGYSSLPDQRAVFTLDRVIDYASMGISLTVNGALSPSATTTGLLLFHPDARYF